MSKEEFFDLVDECNYGFITLSDIRYAEERGWIDENKAEILAGIVLNC